MENKRLPTTEHSWKFVKIEKSSLSTVWLRRQDFSEYERKNEVEYLVENLFYEDNSFINNCNFAFFCAILKNRISVFMILPYCLLKGIVSGDFQPLFNLKKSHFFDFARIFVQIRVSAKSLTRRGHANIELSNQIYSRNWKISR